MGEPTPGPYHVFTKNWGFQIVSDEMPAEVLAVVNVDLVSGDAEANARLFAASPDLLEAAKQAHDELSQYIAPWAERLAEKLENAIRKAESHE